jgi:hypothetical protein
MYRLINPAKALRTLRKTPVLLEALLEGVTQEQAEALHDGDWNVIFDVCHMRDFEAVAAQRVRALLAGSNPAFAVVSNDELIRDNNYAAADLRQVMGEIARLRREFIALLEALTDDQWLLEGVHPAQGPATLLDVAINAGLHDVDHLEQVVRCLAPLREVR